MGQRPSRSVTSSNEASWAVISAGTIGAGSLQRVEVLTLHGPRRRATGDVFVDQPSSDEPAGEAGVGRMDLELLIEGRVSKGQLFGSRAENFLLEAAEGRIDRVEARPIAPNTKAPQPPPPVRRLTDILG